MTRYVPSLVQVSSESRGLDEPEYICDPDSGLLYAPDDVTPVIERALQEGGKATTRTPQLQTLFTKADSDPLDPDVVRSLATGRLPPLDTDIQKLKPDPDVIRGARTRAPLPNKIDL